MNSQADIPAESTEYVPETTTKERKFYGFLTVKSLVTLVMTAALVALMFLNTEPPRELLALFCTSYGAIVTYFFTRKTDGQ